MRKVAVSNSFAHLGMEISMSCSKYKQVRGVEWAFSISSGLGRAASEDALSSYHNTFLLALSTEANFF